MGIFHSYLNLPKGKLEFKIHHEIPWNHHFLIFEARFFLETVPRCWHNHPWPTNAPLAVEARSRFKQPAAAGRGALQHLSSRLVHVDPKLWWTMHELWWVQLITFPLLCGIAGCCMAMISMQQMKGLGSKFKALGATATLWNLLISWLISEAHGKTARLQSPGLWRAVNVVGG